MKWWIYAIIIVNILQNVVRNNIRYDLMWYGIYWYAPSSSDDGLSTGRVEEAESEMICCSFIVLTLQRTQMKNIKKLSV